jgi:hypothetical protein
MPIPKAPPRVLAFEVIHRPTDQVISRHTTWALALRKIKTMAFDEEFYIAGPPKRPGEIRKDY